MVTLAVLAIVVGIAVPSFNNQIQNNRSVALADELVTALNYARSEAVKRGRRVSLCASGNGATCGTTWTDGWMVFVDTAGETATAPTVGEVLRVWEAPDPNAVITVTRNGPTIATNFVRYNNLGALALYTSVSMQSRFNGCTGERARTTTINRGGTVSSTASDC
jgi:type IV fimbrial biogenesis protein FimT